MAKFIDKTGMVFGRLTVLGPSHRAGSGNRLYYLCRCNCKSQTEVTVCTNELRKKETKGIKSCGCLYREWADGKQVKMIGKSFGRLTVISRNEEVSQKSKKNLRGRTFYNCICSCDGKIVIVVGDALTEERGTKSCGCLQEERLGIKGRPDLDLTGQTFGRLLVLEEAGRTKTMQILWRCQCQCEEKNINIVNSNRLKRGNVRSCGCLRRDLLTQRTGPDHPSWNPVLTDEERKRQRRGATEWSRKVKKNADGICYISGQKANKICAHHVESWNSRPDLRYNLENGVAIEFDLHILYHQLYGYGSNTGIELNEFKFRYKSGELDDALRNSKIKRLKNRIKKLEKKLKKQEKELAGYGMLI